MITTEYKNIFVSSENRDTELYPSGNSYTLVITHPLKYIKRVELLHASVPNTMYNISIGTDVIQVSNTSANHTEDATTFSVPSGFYSGPGLAQELTATLLGATGVTVTYLQNEGKFLFTRTGNTFKVVAPTSEMSSVIGLSAGNSQTVATETDLNLPLYSNHSRYTGKNFIKSTVVANLHPHEGIFLDIEELRTNNNEDAVPLIGNTYSGHNISKSFGLIPMDVNGGEIKRYKKNSDFDFAIDYPYPIQSLSKLTVQWVDKNGNRVNFNGLNDNSFLLRFHTLKKIS
tara:strand:- start:81 stop:941 length:861 start_codon:yes stop_codon:yes gene_type:complete